MDLTIAKLWKKLLDSDESLPSKSIDEIEKTARPLKQSVIHPTIAKSWTKLASDDER